MTKAAVESDVILLKHWHELPPPLFILAPPRSFTSLTCAMIGRHPQMYGFPETHLLTFEQMAERAKDVAESTFPMGHGLLRVVAQLYFGEQTEASVRKAQRWLDRRSNLTTEFLFRILCDRVFPRIAVDKSPSMVTPEALGRIRANFPHARFIHLLRHPRGHAESVIKYIHMREKRGPIPPSHWLMQISTCPPPNSVKTNGDQGTPLDPQYGWYSLNKSISDFLKTVPAKQSMRVRGEELLGDPDKVLKDIAAWMELRTDNEAIHRMKHPELSPYAFLGPPGARYGNDVFFLESPSLRASRTIEPLSVEGPLGWRNDGEGFCPEVKLLAREYGYDEPKMLDQMPVSINPPPRYLSLGGPLKDDSVVARDTRFSRPRLLRVNDRIYSAIGYAMSNVIYVVTGESVVVIDTTESMSSARASLEEFRKTCQLPVSHIIYTHFHGDHIRGARVFHEPSTKVIAQQRLPEEVAYVTRMLPYRKRVTALQFGFQLSPEQRGVAMVGERENGYVAPDILFDEEHQFREGDLTFELFHTQGETVDHLMVWIPELGTLLPGDLYYANFPMLSNPMRPDRPVQTWAESLERMRTFQSEFLVPSHGDPVTGADEIDLVLANYTRAIRHVHDATIKLINDGLPLEKIRAQVRLPEDLASLPYLQQRYGKVAWAVNGIFRQHTGWYDFDPAELNPAARTEFRSALIEAMGGPAPLIEQARKALGEDRHQLALELADVVLGGRPLSLPAKALRLHALERLAEASENGVEQNIYRTAAKRALRAFDPQVSGETGPPRLNYSGVWTKPMTEALTPQSESTPAKAPSGLELQKRTAARVNQWYDDRMFADWAARKYALSDFHNLGYWTGQTRTMKESCEKLMEVLLAFFPDRSGKILDVACGKGATTRYLLKYFKPANITGINISEKQLQRCRENAPKCQFLRMNATNMTFGDATFDNLICVEAAHHFAPREAFLAGAHRILRPGGRLVLSDILLSAQQSIRRAECPTQNFISPLGYGQLYLRAGFSQVEIVDASRECFSGFRTHILHSLFDKWLAGAIDISAFRAGASKQLRKKVHPGYYVLVCAQKGESQ